MKYSPSTSFSDPAVLEEFQHLASLLNVVIADKLETRHTAPEKPYEGQLAICDGGDWNPLGDGVRKPVWFDGQTHTWNNYGEGTGGALVHAVVGTIGQISVDNTDQQNPVLSLHVAVLNSLALANSALQPGAAQPPSTVLTAYAGGNTPSAFTLGIVDATDAAAWRTALGAGTALDLAANYTWTGHHDFNGNQARFTGTFAAWGAGPGFECGVANPYGYGSTAFFVGYDRTGSAYIPMGFESSYFHFDLTPAFDLGAGGSAWALNKGPTSSPANRIVSLGTGPAQFTGVFAAAGYAPSTRPGVEFGYSEGFSGAFMQAYNWGAEVHIPFNISASEIGFRIGGSYDLGLFIDSARGIHLPGGLSEYASDALASAGGIAVGQLYRTASAIMIRVV